METSQEQPFDRQLLQWMREDLVRLGASDRLVSEFVRSQEERLLINYGSQTVYVRGRSCRGADAIAVSEFHAKALKETGNAGAALERTMKRFEYASRQSVYNKLREAVRLGSRKRMAK